MYDKPPPKHDKPPPIHDKPPAPAAAARDSGKGPSIKDVGIFLAVFDTPLPQVGILTLIYLTSTF